MHPDTAVRPAPAGALLLLLAGAVVYPLAPAGRGAGLLSRV